MCSRVVSRATLFVVYGTITFSIIAALLRDICSFAELATTMKVSLAILLFLYLLDSTRSQQTASEQEKWRQEQQRARQKKRRAQQRQRERERQQSKFSQYGGSHFNFTNAYEGIGSIFPSQAPRDAIEGSMQAIKSAVVGSVTGIVALVVFPFALAKNLGIWGYPLGAVLGGLSGGSMLIAGVATGIYQFLLGIKNTPEALQATWQGKQWDTDSRSWKIYSLGQESEELLSEKNRNRRVQDLSFYEVLGVESSATSKEIKKAYYQKAKELHPDKNPGDEEAAAKFLVLREAYQTLSDEKTRSAYDQYGTASSSDQQGSNFYFNADVFFEILFGVQSEVEPYVGKLTVATFVGQMMRLYQAGIVSQETWSIFREESSLQTRKRQVEIASNLLARIEPFVRGKMTAVEFRSSCRVEAERMSDSVFGARFLGTIGRSLQLEAGAYLNFRKPVTGWPASTFLTLKRKYQRWGGIFGQFRKVWEILNVIVEGAEVVEGEPRTRITNETIINALPIVLEMAWAHNEGDIAFTLEKACEKVFRDVDAGNAKVRNLRAEGILLLGQEFTKVAISKMKQSDSETCDDSNMQSENVQARIAVALHVATLKGSQGQVNVEEIEEMIRRQSSIIK
eukprot:scaffold222_cov175-Amphora_coffeaeformis.AAC.8